MKLQLACDDLDLQSTIDLVEKIQNYIDIVEIGTPMVFEYGMTAVKEIKQKFPHLEILADLKIMDAGYFEAKQALSSGANYITVLGTTDNLTIQGCVEAAKEYEGKVVVDMICVEDLKERIKKVEQLGVDYVSVHVGVDQQAQGRTPLDDLKIMKEATTIAKVSVAGGIHVETIQDYVALSPDIVIVGSGITHSSDPVTAAKTLSEVIHGKCNK